MIMRTRVAKHLSDLRSIIYLLDGNTYRSLYESANPEFQAKLDQLISACCDTELSIRERAKRRLKDILREHDQSVYTMLEIEKLCETFGLKYKLQDSKEENLSRVLQAKYEQINSRRTPNSGCQSQ